MDILNLRTSYLEKLKKETIYELKKEGATVLVTLKVFEIADNTKGSVKKLE